MQTLKLPSCLARTVVAAALGAGAVFAVSTAHAGIVYSGQVSITVPATTAGLYLNVVTGVASTSPFGAPGWDINPFSSIGLGFFSPASPAGGVYVLSGTVTAANLSPGATIGAGNTFGGGASANASQWALDSSDNLLGFKFINEAGNTLHYGWARFAIGSSILDRRIVGYAYESIPNTSIGAGATGMMIPEPGTPALLALALLGMLAASRRPQR